MPFTNATAARIRALNFGGTPWTGRPTTLYLGLLTEAPTAAGTYKELSGKAYARKVMQAADWWVYGNTAINAAATNWPAPASGDWDQATHIGIFSKATGGVLLFWATLSNPVIVPANGTYSIAAGGLSITMGGSFGTLSAFRTLRLLFNNIAFTSPATFYVGVGSNVDADQLYGEPVAINGATATAYARGTIANTTAKWPADTDDTNATHNSLAVSDFPAATADWGQLGSGGLLDAAIVTGATYAQSSTGIVISKTAHGLTAIDTTSFPTISGATWERAATTVTVTTAQPHGLAVGDRVYLNFSGSSINRDLASSVITAVTATTFTITDGSSGTASGTVDINRVPTVDLWFISGTNPPVSRRYHLANIGDAGGGIGFAGSTTADKFTVEIDSSETIGTPSGNCVFSSAHLLFGSSLTSPVTINAADTPTAPINGITPTVLVE